MRLPNHLKLLPASRLAHIVGLATCCIMFSASIASATTIPDTLLATPETVSAPPMPSPLAPSLEKLKNDVVNLEVKAQDTIDNQRYPAYTRVRTYVGVNTKDVIIKSIRVNIDDKTATTHHYEATTAYRLINHGLAPLDELNVQPGHHTLTVVLTYAQHHNKKKDSKPGEQNKTTTVKDSFKFTKTDQAAQLVIDVYSPLFFGSPSLRLTQWEPKP